MLSADLIPGKIFILGEYSVLSGHPALVAPIRVLPGESFFGLGSSTARWVAENAKAAKLPTVQLWNQYRKDNSLGSGADLIAQNEAFLGKGPVFEISIEPFTRENHDTEESFTLNTLPVNPLWEFIHVFSAAHDLSRKLNTQKDLRSLSQPEKFPNSQSVVEQFKNAKTVSDYSVFNEWSNQLSELGLETRIAHETRMYIQSLKGVVGVKGCGAGLNDIFIAAIAPIPKGDELNSARGSTEELIHLICQERQLKYLGTLTERLWKK